MVPTVAQIDIPDIKADAATKNIPVIMFSAHPGAADKIDTYGADDFIAKPINADSLLEKITRQLHQAEQ